MKRTYPLTYLLIFLNVAVFLAGFVVGEDRIYQAGAMDGAHVAAGQWYRLFTSGFIHSNLGHIAVNMLSLYYMGSFTELAMGKLRMFAV